jgi:non-canonical purine NTP pyrophosphatase (RdgB/HAM1 family)
MGITFVTGNEHKAAHTARLLGRRIDHEKIDLDELQTVDIVELIEHKVRQAYEKIKRPVIVDDYSVGFDALDGLPGPFIKFFIGTDEKLEKLCRILDVFKDRSADATSAIGFYDGVTLKVFRKTLRGTIAINPAGDNGIHSDKIFIPTGYKLTRAQMDNDMYDAIYKQVRPLDELREFLNEYYGAEEQ